LRTPLTSLRGSLVLLADGSVGPLPADAQRLLRLAHDNSERLVHLVNDILDFEKLRAGGLQLDIESLDLADVAREAIESVEGMSHQARVSMQLHDGGMPLPVRADAARLVQVLANLLSNAIKYAPPHGTVLVTVEAHGERARATVRDDGPGVPADFVPHLFEPFAQARSAQHRRQGGTGLGLAISRGLIEMMHGGIGLEPPQRGAGASFWIELPLHSARPSTFGDL
jgi:signal transduction histidine kinase